MPGRVNVRVTAGLALAAFALPSAVVLVAGTAGRGAAPEQSAAVRAPSRPPLTLGRAAKLPALAAAARPRLTEARARPPDAGGARALRSTPTTTVDATATRSGAPTNPRRAVVPAGTVAPAPTVAPQRRAPAIPAPPPPRATPAPRTPSPAGQGGFDDSGPGATGDFDSAGPR
jgi:hypothetical protein